MAEAIMTIENRAKGLELVNDAGMQLECLSIMVLKEIERLALGEIEGIKSAVVRMQTLSQLVIGAADAQFSDEYLKEMRSTIHGI